MDTKRIHTINLVKSTFLSGSFFGLLMLVIGCSQDDGNYDYVDPGTVDFFGMVEEFSALVGEQLYIEPVFTTNANEQDLSYLWYITYVNEDNQSVADTISRERVLDVINSLPVGDQTLFFNVYNRALDVNYRHDIDVSVATPFSEGWGILRDVGGTAELDFISFVTDDHLKDLLSGVSGITVSGTPVSLDYWIFTGISGNFQTLSILTEEDYVIFDNSNLSVYAQGLDENFGNTEDLTLPIQGGRLGATAWQFANTGIIQIGGSLYARGNLLSYFEPAPVFSGTPVLGEYGLPSEFFGSLLYFDKYVFFDELNKRYMWFWADEGSNYVAEPFLEPANKDAFDPNDQSGKEMIWLGSQTNDTFFSGEGLSVMKDEAGTYFLQKFSVDYVPTFNPVFELEIPDGYVDDNSLWINSPLGSFTYFEKDGVIGLVTDAGESQSINQNFITDYAGQDIMAMHVTSDGFTMALAIANGANSLVVLFDLVDEVEVASYDVEGRVVDLEYHILE